MECLAVLGREPEISLAELEAQFSNVKQISDHLATFDAKNPSIDRLGGTIKLAEKIDKKPIDYLSSLDPGKITFGLSDYSPNATQKSITSSALKLKQILSRHGRSTRAVIDKSSPVLSTATSLHNGLSGKNPKKIELVKFQNTYYKVIGIQDIDAYTRRDRLRPARDAKVGMLPPKLAQILINLCGPLPEGSRLLDPFCGTGVVLQEALLMGYRAYGTDLDPRMVDYTKKNLDWLKQKNISSNDIKRKISDFSRAEVKQCDKISDLSHCETHLNYIFLLNQGDATSFQWTQPIDLVACETYLGAPMSTIPSEIKLKEQKQECSHIILQFLKNLSAQIKKDTPVTIAIPAWARPNDTYSRLEILDEIANLGYNVSNKSRDGLLYYRKGQVVARDIIILRKK